MNTFVVIAMLVATIGLFVHAMYKRERRLQEINRKIVEVQDRYLSARSNQNCENRR
jgi:preprotein translocase subunit YajC